jgi:integrative and conjugative element protein (TIGR02256 family)
MQLLLPLKVTKQLRRELLRADDREIGGLLLGEHVRDEVFRIVEISVQRLGGSHSRFTRQPEQHQKQLNKFLRRTGGDYRRFNYLGEWHSHPCFTPTPSMEDVRTMQSMVCDPVVGANFLVLLICRLEKGTTLELCATMFRANCPPKSVSVENDAGDPAGSEGRARRWFRKILSF